MASCDATFGVPFITMWYVSYSSVPGSEGENGPEIGLQWVYGIEKGLLEWLE